MIDFLETIRTSNKDLPKSKKMINSTLIFIFGIILGIFSKWLDSLALSDSIWWHEILETLDLGKIFSTLSIWLLLALSISIFSSNALRASLNVFLFFLGMCSSYHIYSIVFLCFNPLRYMMIWYCITLLSPVLGFFSWYAKGSNFCSLLLKIFIVTVMLFFSFSIGLWYFDFISIINSLIFLITLIILYDNPKNFLITLTSSVILAYSIRFFL